jgi:hypothetical protein
LESILGLLKSLKIQSQRFQGSARSLEVLGLQGFSTPRNSGFLGFQCLEVSQPRVSVSTNSEPLVLEHPVASRTLGFQDQGYQKKRVPGPGVFQSHLGFQCSRVSRTHEFPGPQGFQDPRVTMTQGFQDPLVSRAPGFPAPPGFQGSRVSRTHEFPGPRVSRTPVFPGPQGFQDPPGRSAAQSGGFPPNRSHPLALNTGMPNLLPLL